MSDLVRFSVSMPEALVADFDALIASQGYQTRSEAVRDLIRDRLVQKEWEGDDQIVAGTLTLIYDHHSRGLAERLTEVQHGQIGLVVSTLHVHLDERNCLEVLVMKGVPAQLRRVSDRLVATRGVKHGKLVFTTTGESLR
jgi:CopG family nickel-responsive transcriptional regulator